jgi:gas vesicle protein
LTPSKQKRRSQGDPPKTSTKQKPSDAERESDRWLEWEDSLLKHCHAIETLAALLFHTGRNDGATVDVVNDTGGMIKAEVAQLKRRVQARPGRGAK